MLSDKMRDFILKNRQSQTDAWSDQYMNTDNVEDIWFGGLDLGSRYDYAQNYMSPEQREGWAAMSPTQRRQVLGDTVNAASEDEDDSFGQKLVKKGVPLAVAALGAYGAYTGLAGMGGGAGAGGGGGTLGGVADAAGNIIPGTEPMVGGGGGIMRGLGGLFKNPDGTLNWGNVIKGAGAAAGFLGGAAYDEPASDGAHAPVDNTPLQQLTYGRQRNAGPSDYFSYGRGAGGGEHKFFTDATFAEAPGGQQNAPGGTPTGYVPEEVMNRGMLQNMMHKARGGSTSHVRGPGSGREDKIEALLSADEYVIDAETVAMLGDGSPEEGARRLDDMRKNIRQHKGKALAKGKFSPDARAPEQYIGKSRGGGIKRVIKGGVPKPSVPDKQAQLDAIRRFEAAFRAAKRAQPVKKAAGGLVDTRGPMQSLVRLANQLQRALSAGDTEKVTSIGKELNGQRKGASDEAMRAFARGGSVTAVLKKLFAAAPDERPPPIRNEGTHSRMDSIAAELEKLNPQSEALRHYRAQSRSKLDVRRRRPQEQK